jgi:hypothetical protein
LIDLFGADVFASANILKMRPDALQGNEVDECNRQLEKRGDGGSDHSAEVFDGSELISKCGGA